MTDRIDFDQVREVVRIAAESDVAELEVETPALKIRVRKAAASPASINAAALGADPAVLNAAPAVHAAVTASPGTAPGAAALASTARGAGEDHLVPIIAPMVGTFYRAASPEAAPFVREGDLVEEGQVVCIIEAMKLFNEIPSEARGRIARILVENASPVEYGQSLFLIDTAAVRT